MFIVSRGEVFKEIIILGRWAKTVEQWKKRKFPESYFKTFRCFTLYRRFLSTFVFTLSLGRSFRMTTLLIQAGMVYTKEAIL